MYPRKKKLNPEWQEALIRIARAIIDPGGG